MRYFFRYIVIFVIGTACLITGTPNKDTVCMIGHRGYSSKYLENTESAFVEAAKHGSGGVETDVRVTKDNKLILSHGDTAEYVDGTVLTISENNFDDLTAKPLKNKFKNGEVYLCSFERYLEICRDNDMICFIEFKGTFSDELITAAFTLADSVYELDKCILQSSDMDNLIRAHELFHELAIMLTYGRNQYESGVDYTECFKYGFDIDADYCVVSRQMIEEFHSRGLEVGVWTCNDRLALNYAYWLGVDYIESDVY